jgi:acetate kinase
MTILVLNSGSSSIKFASYARGERPREIVERLRLSGEGATTPKRHIEKTWGLAAEDQHVIRVVREETVLAR